MSTKKEKRTAEKSARKKKKTTRSVALAGAALLGVAIAAFLIFTYSGQLSSPQREAAREKIKASLYFSDSNERFLAAETRFIPKGKNQSAQVAEIVNALIEGPHEGLVRTVPEKSKLINARVDANGIAVVNFDSSFIENHPGGSSSEISTIYSLTNSITRNMPEIKRVKIVIDGKEMETLKGHIDARYPFAPNMDLVSRESAG